MTSHISPAKLPVLLKILLVIALLLGFAGPFAMAQESSSSSEPAASSEPPPEEVTVPVLPTPDTVVATVNGEPITQAQLSFVQEDLASQLSQIPPEALRSVLLAQMINLKLMAGAGRAAGLEDTDTFKRRVSYLVERSLSRAYAQEKIGAEVTPEAIQAEYDAVFGSAPSEELHTLHILVSTEEDAKAIKASLDAGGDFAALAKEKSIDPSAKQNGGDLGFVQYWGVVKPFADVAFALKDGETSAPVESQFGWHVIRVLERRPTTKPTLAETQAQIGQKLYNEKYQAAFDALRSAATIDIPDPTLKAQVDVQLAPQ
jgi:peptidyl-prolyl cis-trans isomerase C